MTEGKKRKGEFKKLGTPTTSYGSIAHLEIPKIFFQRFFKKLDTALEKYFGKEQSLRIRELLEQGKLKIVNPGNFFFSYDYLNDTSINEYTDDTDIELFFYRTLLKFKRQAENGTTEIVIREFFLVLAHLLAEENKKFFEEQLKFFMKTFLILLTNIEHASPFNIKIFDPTMIPQIHNLTNLNLTKYGKVLKAFLESYDELFQSELFHGELFLPKIEVYYPVYRDNRSSQISFLSSLFRIIPEKLAPFVSNVKNLGEDSPQLRTSLNALAAKKGWKNFDIEPALIGLKEIEVQEPYKKYLCSKNFSEAFHSRGMKRGMFSTGSRLAKVCANSELLYEYFNKPYFADVMIDCKNSSKNEIETLIDLAVNLNLLKVYVSHNFRKELIGDNPPLKITLVDVEEINQSFVDFIKNKIAQVRSLTNKDFFVEVLYSYAEVTKTVAETKATHIRIISDIHADYNRNKKYSFYFGDDFVINCGDTASNSKDSLEWTKNHLIKSVFVAGNHLGYSPSLPELNLNIEENLKNYGYATHIENTKSRQIAQLGEWCDSNNKLLSNASTEYEGILIIGSTLYTDFALYGKEHIEECMKYAQENMNDFQLVTVMGNRSYEQTENGWVKTLKKLKDSKIRLFTPQDHAYYFKHSMDVITDLVEENKDKPIVIATHHAPSPYSISPKYAGSMLNPAFASNLNEFIINHPNIRVWAHGHIHSSSDYILGETRVICEPFGYGNENNMENCLPFNYGKRIAIKDIKSKKSWTEILSEDIQKGLIKVYEK